jgi:hypothetical protein
MNYQKLTVHLQYKKRLNGRKKNTKKFPFLPD